MGWREWFACLDGVGAGCLDGVDGDDGVGCRRVVLVWGRGMVGFEVGGWWVRWWLDSWAKRRWFDCCFEDGVSKGIWLVVEAAGLVVSCWWMNTG